MNPAKAGVKIAPNMHANGGPKRMLVKNFKVMRKVDPRVFVEQTWERLSAALNTVFSGDKVDFSLEELYRGVENLCRQGMAEDTASRLKPKLQEGVDELFDKFWDKAQGYDHVDFLRATVQAWETWMERMVSALVLGTRTLVSDQA
jgi:cullin-4